ncbi:MAG: cytochrome c biogenesis protein ResB, partial [Desulfobacteraceae bacterium]|nr:cytochrome c biogenesis protein ResB [Desulfobacteraceae bacterium]
MIMGLCIVFLLSHQRVCIEVVRSGNKSRVMVAGTADKNRIGMQKKLRRISQDLASIETHDTLGGPRAQNTRVVYE